MLVCSYHCTYVLVGVLLIGQILLMLNIFWKHSHHNRYKPDDINIEKLENEFIMALNDVNVTHVSNGNGSYSNPIPVSMLNNDSLNIKWVAPLLTSPISCESSDYVLLIVNSKAEHQGRRLSIRQSWANSNNIDKYNDKTKIKTATRLRFRVVFIIGLSPTKDINRRAELEFEKYGDLIIGDFIDNMKSLTIKTTLGMQWAYYHCSPVVFYKGDDDVFVNPYLVYDIAEDYASTKTTKQWICRAHLAPRSRVPMRNKKHRYYVPQSKFRDKLFPFFCSGFAYIMTGDVLHGMVENIQKTPLIEVVDDAFVGILAAKIHVVPKHDKRFKVYDRFDRRPRKTNANSEVSLMRQTIAEHGIYYLHMKKYMDNTNKAMLVT